ncbi:MAG: YcxB family protein [Christensenellales bacterium]
MKISYTYNKEDYLRGLSLLYINRQRDTRMLRLFWKVAVGCAVYLSTAALRGMLSENDIVSYLAGVAVFLLLMLVDHPRLLPALLFDRRLAQGKIPQGVLGSHEVEATGDAIAFRSPGVEHRMRYGNLIRVSVFDDAALFYQGDGAAEYLPAHAFGSASAFQEAVNGLRQLIQNGKQSDSATQPLPPAEAPHGQHAQVRVTQDQYLAVNALHEKHTARARLRRPRTLLWTGLVLWIGAGSLKGLAGLLQGAAAPMGIVYAYYAAGILTLCLGALLLWRPIRLVNWVLRKKLQMQQYPFGFFDRRALHWTGDWIALEYGVTGMKLAWSYFTHIVSDGRFYLFYQGETLVFFTPLKDDEGAALEGLGEEIRRHADILPA